MSKTKILTQKQKRMLKLKQQYLALLLVTTIAMSAISIAYIGVITPIMAQSTTSKVNALKTPIFDEI